MGIVALIAAVIGTAALASKNASAAVSVSSDINARGSAGKAPADVISERRTVNSGVLAALAKMNLKTNPKTGDPSPNYASSYERFKAWIVAKRSVDALSAELTWLGWSMNPRDKEDKESRLHDARATVSELIRASNTNPIAADDKTVREYLYESTSKYLEQFEGIKPENQGDADYDAFNRSLDRAVQYFKHYPPKDLGEIAAGGLLLLAKVAAVALGAI